MATTSVSNDPKLPPELEMEIFRTAARLAPQTISHLLCVAHRAFTWIEPILYETLILSSSTSLALETKPPSFWARNVRNVHIVKSPDKALVLSTLSACTGLESLMVLRDEDTQDIMPLLAPMRLKRLDIDVGQLFGPQVATYDLHLNPTFAGLTHLCIQDAHTFKFTAFSTTLPLLPELTHLRLEFGGLGASGLKLFLRDCKQLRVLISTTPTEFGPASLPTKGLHDDPRFVFLGKRVGEKDYIEGSQWDSWARAEAFVEKKRRGEIDPGESLDIFWLT
ncbi:hypothetical protein FB45DRAFT_141443 [Roridomyces roridus]|uniref:Uncharacterized protein n=1 Tax=Roridomyces roridus TaxID=1738132 RepID=A0AAD7BHV3_9AGAR|nr:hypothetical protein FB45DRAFT_141443 [Roridomyces roridus]